jgi:putative nucleotidyltransferase with HDIG domain
MQGATAELQQIIGGITNLPTPPLVLDQINRTVSDPNASAYDVASILSEDPAMSVKVLRLCNSAWYGLQHQVSSIKQAVVIMGMEAIRSTVLSTAVFDMFKKGANDPKFQAKFWRHSLATATCMRLLVRTMSGQWITKSELAFSAGLLHDIGRLVMSSFLPDDFQTVGKFQEENSVTMLKAEETVLDYTHSDVGALLAQKWNLPAQLRAAIQFHHYPQLSDEDIGLVHLTHLADYLAHVTYDNKDDGETEVTPLDLDTISTLDITEDQLKTLSESLREEYTKAETFMQMATGM